MTSCKYRKTPVIPLKDEGVSDQSPAVANKSIEDIDSLYNRSLCTCIESYRFEFYHVRKICQ